MIARSAALTLLLASVPVMPSALVVPSATHAATGMGLRVWPA
ncbi:hypothetical protein [Nonomuraea montanisoli]|nr:hypothetical protein [Nonomuraea montanisoli]